MRTGVPNAKWPPKYMAVSPKAMNITPDKKSLLRNRLNDASPTQNPSSVGYWARTPGPAQWLAKHESAALPKRQVHSRSSRRTAMTARQRANNRRSTATGARADQRAASGATKSAGSDSAATQNNATSPSASTGRPGVPRSRVRKKTAAGRAITRLNKAPAPIARLMGKEKSDSTGVLNVPPPTPTADASAPTIAGDS